MVLAGVTEGTFSAFIRDKVKGSAQHKGIELKVLEKNSILCTVQTGNKDTCFLIRLLIPKECPVPAKDIFTKFGPPVAAPLSTVEGPEEIPESAPAPPEVPAEHPKLDVDEFLSDKEQVDLLGMGLNDLMRERKEAFFFAADFRKIVREHNLVSSEHNNNSLGQMIRSLVKRQILVRSELGFYASGPKAPWTSAISSEPIKDQDIEDLEQLVEAGKKIREVERGVVEIDERLVVIAQSLEGLEKERIALQEERQALLARRSEFQEQLFAPENQHIIAKLKKALG